MKNEEQFNLEEIRKKALEQFRSGKSLYGKDGAFAPMFKSFLEAALEGELDAHLDVDERKEGNRKNGKGSKTSDLRNRGVADILIACIDNLNGFAEAIQSTFPKVEVQSCIVHQVRNSLKYVASKDQKPFLSDLKEVYRATTKELAEQQLDVLDKAWGKKYPLVIYRPNF